MGIALYGNINGHSYTPTTIKLLDSTQKMNAEQKTVSETYLNNDQAVKVDISEEGLRALHGSKLPGSADPFETRAYIAYMSEHQPIESFTNQFSQMMPKNYTISESGEKVFSPHTMEEKETALVNGFKELYDQISKEYDEGTRVRYIEDSSSEDGYRKLTKEEELSILKMEFDDYVDSRFGDERKAQNEAVKTALRSVQELKKSLGRIANEEMLKIEEIPDGFADKLKSATASYAESHGLMLDYMKAFIKNLKDEFSPIEMNFQKLM